MNGRVGRRGRYLWIVALVVLAAGIVLAIVRLDAGSNANGPGSVREQLHDRMVTVLEQSTPAGHHHEHATELGADARGSASAEPAELVCAARVFGFEPENATSVKEITRVYGFHLCGIVEKGIPWDVTEKLVGPLIMDMTTDPPGIQVVEATPTVKYVDRVRQLIPVKYQEDAMGGRLGEEAMRDVRKRYAAASGT